jgi:hypothetical protein
MGRGPVPDQPHLLVVPNSLVPQWTRELKTFFNYRQIEIHPLPKSEAEVEKYLKSDAWTKSGTPKILRILIVSHTVRLFIANPFLLSSRFLGTGKFNRPVFRHEEKHAGTTCRHGAEGEILKNSNVVHHPVLPRCL